MKLSNMLFPLQSAIFRKMSRVCIERIWGTVNRGTVNRGTVNRGTVNRGTVNRGTVAQFGK